MTGETQVLSARSRRDLIAISARSQCDLSAISVRSQCDLSAISVRSQRDLSAISARSQRDLSAISVRSQRDLRPAHIAISVQSQRATPLCRWSHKKGSPLHRPPILRIPRLMGGCPSQICCGQRWLKLFQTTMESMGLIWRSLRLSTGTSKNQIFTARHRGISLQQPRCTTG